nr:Uncharacterised protein [Klebsiella pneumoniae]
MPEGCNGFHLLTAGMSTALSLPTARRRRWRAWFPVPLMSHGRDSPRTMIDYEATGLNDTLSWLGPFWFALKMRPSICSR